MGWRLNSVKAAAIGGLHTPIRVAWRTPRIVLSLRIQSARVSPESKESHLQKVRYTRANSVDEAIALLEKGGATARPLAGGTDLIVQARERRRKIDLFVDIKPIPETNEIAFDSTKGLTVGAAVPAYLIYGNETVRKLYPALVDACRVIGGTAIQGRASLGGNLCNSSPAADSVPAMIALEGVANVAGPKGRRSVLVDTFNTGPGQNVLQPGEFVLSIQFPAPAANSGAAWDRFIPRNEMDIAVVNAGVQLRFDGERVSWAKIAIGAVAPTALVVPAAAEALTGKPLSDATIEAAAAAARDAARPIDDMRGSIRQRKHLVGVYVSRMIRKAAERARGG
jgi:carbon-monoxide dehydrogenase medium subunit